MYKEYGKWSGGKSFFMYDSPMNYAMLNTLSLDGNFFTKDNTIDFENEKLKKVTNDFYSSAIRGNMCLMDDFATTAIMTGSAVCGIESTASILYYQDTVTYPDNRTEPLKLKILPIPTYKDAKKMVIQRGVGLCALKSDEAKQFAASVFCKWLTKEQTNLSFVTSAGYMPVKKNAYQSLMDGTYTDFQSDTYKNLYDVIGQLYKDFTFYTPPNFDSYGLIEKNYSTNMKKLLKEKQKKHKTESDLSTLSEETRNTLKKKG